MHDPALGDGDGLTGTASARARAFDLSFARIPEVRTAEPVDLLSIRLGGDPFAIRLEQTAGLFADRRTTPVPGTIPEFRGLAGVRGALVPVFDLAALLGYAAAPAPRWLAAARDGAIAFAFDAFEGQLRATTDDVIAQNSGGRNHVREVVRVGGRTRQVVDLPALVAAIGRRATDPRKET